jgi:hypothetical protein
MPFNQSWNRKSRRKAVPALGAAGLSLSLSSGGWAAPAADVPQWNAAGNHEIILGEEEIADVSLATFHVFDNGSRPQLGGGVRLAAGGHGGCGGCGGHGGCGGCGGHGGCGGCGGHGCAGCAHAGFAGCAHAGGCAGCARVGGCFAHGWMGHGCGHGCRCRGGCRCAGIFIGASCLGCGVDYGTCYQWDPYLGRWIYVCY